MRLYLKRLGAFKKPCLNVDASETNKGKRLKYCLKYKNFNFKRVLFSDESLFQLNANNQRVFHLKGQLAPKKKKYNPNIKIMVWGAISYEAKTSLHIVRGNLNADNYLKLLKEKGEK